MAIKKYTEAVVKIQRRFRLFLKKREKQAATILLRAFRRSIAKKQARRVFLSLRSLRSSSCAFRELTEKYRTALQGQQDLSSVAFRKLSLIQQDSLEKLLLKMDNISIYDNSFLRSTRKSIVSDIQRALQDVDNVFLLSATPAVHPVTPAIDPCIPILVDIVTPVSSTSTTTTMTANDTATADPLQLVFQDKNSPEHCDGIEAVFIFTDEPILKHESSFIPLSTEDDMNENSGYP